MIKSMTGFGRCEVSEGERKITVEVKSVNHRYLDVAIKMPKKLNLFETAIRALLKEYISRGKTDIFITYEDMGQKGAALAYNASIAAQYMQYFTQMEQEFGIRNDICVSDLARFPDVLTIGEQQEDEEEIWHLLERALRGACERFVESREREGDALKADLIGKLDEMLVLVAQIEERSPGIVQEYRQKLETKVRELLDDTQLDESRLLTEVTLFADKVCVDEEIVRLKSHIEAMKAVLEAGGEVGRRLDFIAQEMNREANATLSKANDLTFSDCAIDLKTGIEKVREQIQNIE
ncbi:MAG: YicC family protein [Lachnospiraceae bacterium]|nr:YicC family protein [Lachnospiraceae bacterium]